MHLLGFDLHGAVVFDQSIPLHEYYEELHPVIDSDDFRREQRIARLLGTKYGAEGKVEEEWENHYTAAGAFTGGIVRDQHGNIIRELT
jgi:hypothetical protein